MAKIDEIKNKLNLLGMDIEEALRLAYNNGYLDGLSTDKPSQDEFNEAHSSVMAYGEEQDLLILGNQYTYDEAKAKYVDYCKSELGWDDEEIGDPDDHVKGSYVSYELYEGEPTYYVRSDRGGIYNCWLWELEV